MFHHEDLDVSRHSSGYAGALDRTGKRLFDHALPNDETRLRPVLGPSTDRGLVVLLPKPRPRVCDQQTITVPPSAGAKCEQEYPYQAERWAEQYTPVRQSVESMDNSLKHGAHVPIDDPQNRPRRGWIAQFISLVTMLVATNTRKIIAWLIDQIGVASISTAPVERARDRHLTREAPQV